MEILDFLPDNLRQQLRDSAVEFLADYAEKIVGEKTAKTIRLLSSQAEFNKSFDYAMETAVKRFIAEYTIQDEDLVEAIIKDTTFWKHKDVQQTLMILIRRPGSWLANEQGIVLQHFSNVLPNRVNRERVNKAVNSLLGYIVEEIWTLPGVSEIREIYSLQFQKIGVDIAKQQTALLESQLRATTQMSIDVRQALLQLATALETRLITAPSLQPALRRTLPYQNLPQPDYTTFVGRQKELSWLYERLLPTDRTWQIAIVGMGGIGKSALALAMAHHYLKHYDDSSPQERFEAIIWITAKEEVLTIQGKEKSTLPSLVSHNIEDIYSAIAQTLEREDITRAILENQDHLVQKILSTQRTLLIIDNIESITDKRVKVFLRNLPAPTKCVITSREWVPIADIWRLTGLTAEEAKKMVIEEAITRGIFLNANQQQKLFERTSGLPLPIKLSVARMLSGETFDQIMRWLGNATGDLPEYCIKGQVDRACQLDPHAWKLFLACSLFERNTGASRATLGYIANLSIADLDEGLTLLQRLSLLNYTEGERFWMLPIVQRYAESAFAQSEVGKTVAERWLSWLLEFAQQYRVDVYLSFERLQAIVIEYPNLLTAIHWCYEHTRWKTLINLSEEIWFYPFITGLFNELQDILELSIQSSKVLHNEYCKGKFLRRLGLLYWMQGQYEKVLTECLEEAEKIAQQYNDDTELGWIYFLRSDILFNQGQLLAAEQLSKTMLEIGQRLNDLEMKVWAIQWLSNSEVQRQHFSKALEWLDQGEAWCKESGWSRGLAWIMYRRGAILVQQKNVQKAEEVLMQSLNIAASWNDRRLIANNKYNLAQCYVLSDHLPLAIQVFEEAHDMYNRLGMTKELNFVEKSINDINKGNT